jgi:hypothetical protein
MSDEPGADWSWTQARAHRLARQLLDSRGPALGSSPAQIASAIGAVHAQVMSAAELSIGTRAGDLTKGDVRQALWVDRSLVKSFGPRGTVHLLAATDLAMWTGALAAIPAGAGPPAIALTPAQTDEVVAAIDDALTGAGAELTVEELGEFVVAATGTWATDLVVPAFAGMWPRWRLALATAANRGSLCFGPQRGRNVTYTSPARWLPGFRPAAADLSLRWLLRRYLTAFGPATPAQFAQWLAAPRRWAVDLFTEFAEDLVAVRLDGARAWLPADDCALPTTRASGVRLLPYFDAYVVGCHPRDRVYPGSVAQRALSGGQAGTVPVVLVNGEVAGVWNLRRSGRRLHLGVELLRSLTARQRDQLDEQTDRVATILDGQPIVTFGSIAAGHHL